MDSQELRVTLLELAGNYRWTWKTSCRELLAGLSGASPESHPLAAVRSLDDAQLTNLVADDDFVARVENELADLRRAVKGPPTSIAYLSMEFGISSFVHFYAGGLGVLAGDVLKAAADLRLPMVGIGLFYRYGAFRQEISDGRQVETVSPVEPDDIGAVDTGVFVDVPFPGRNVRARVLRVAVGEVSLLLLDTDVDENSEEDRAIADRLYLGSIEKRVAQEMVLGVGGALALAALDLDVDIYHLNEGHAGFVAFELVDRVIAGGGLGEAVASVKEDIVFTTHTPVPAGIDCLSPAVLMPYVEMWAERWGVSADQIWNLGSDPENGEEFNMAMLCLRMSRVANGVSRLHGEVSRKLFAALPEGREIIHVTNGVHARTWIAPSMENVFDVVLGSGWESGDADAWNRVSEIGDEDLARARRAGSESLAAMLVSREIAVDPDALIVGFARRFAPYKRSTLILRERDRLLELLNDDARPVHILFSGKSHPANELGMSLVSEIVAFASSPEARGRFSFVPDYDMDIGAGLVQGSDIWLNNPVRPHEASGTSGEKVALNGGLNLSVLDGWWAEMYDGENGWAIPSSDADDPELRDSEDAVALIDALVAARDEYFDQRARFNQRVRHAWRTLGPQVTAARMLRDYVEHVYRI